MICPDCGGKKYRRNAESSIRKLEREYAYGDFEAGVRLLRLRMRSGLISIDYVRRAAALGDRRSEVLAHGSEPWPVEEPEYYRVFIHSILRGLPRELTVSFAVDVAERVLPLYEGSPRQQGDTRPRDAIEVTRRWIEDPSEDNRLAAYDATAAAYAAARDADEGWRHFDDLGYLAAENAAYAAAYAAAAVVSRGRRLLDAAAAADAAANARAFAGSSAQTSDGGVGLERAWQKQRLIQYLLGEDDPSGFQPRRLPPSGQ